LWIEESCSSQYFYGFKYQGPSTPWTALYIDIGGLLADVSSVIGGPEISLGMSVIEHGWVAKRTVEGYPEEFVELAEAQRASDLAAEIPGVGFGASLAGVILDIEEINARGDWIKDSNVWLDNATPANLIFHPDSPFW
jgi:hypothetical protein